MFCDGPQSPGTPGALDDLPSVIAGKTRRTTKPHRIMSSNNKRELSYEELENIAAGHEPGVVKTGTSIAGLGGHKARRISPIMHQPQLRLRVWVRQADADE